MTRFKRVSGGFIGAYLLMALSLAQAQNAPGPEGASLKWHSGQRIQEIYDQLNLTGDQKKQLEVNKQQHHARMESARQEMKNEKQALKEELMKPQLDRPKIYGLHSQIKALLSQMEDDKLSSILAVRAILTPEQFSKFITLMHKHKQEHEK